MAPRSLQFTALLAFLALPPGPIAASNPHTVDGQDCGEWRSSAPLSERIRQVRACEGFKTSNALKLAQEFDAGSNGLPMDWAQAATWYRETIKIAAGMGPESLAARRGEAASQRLGEMLWTGGHGLQANPAEAQRLAPINITPGLWEFTSRSSLNGQDLPLANGGRESVCVTADKLATESPFAVATLVENYGAMGCRLEQVQAGTLSADISVDCEEYYDEEWGESVGQIAKVSMRFQGEAYAFTLVATRYPDGAQTVVESTGRWLRTC